MKVKLIGYSLVVLALGVSFAARPASAAPAEEPQAATGCRSISVDLTDPAMVALLKNTQDARPVGKVRVEERGEGAERMRSAAQDFEATTENLAVSKITVTCTSGPCSGPGCAVVGCNPITINGETGCSGCSCVPLPPVFTCIPNACTCIKVTSETPATEL